MIRRFKFEGDIPEELACVPMGVRRKLDKAGIKIGLAHWQSLGRGERLAICHLPANLEEEREAMRQFVAEALQRISGTIPAMLTAKERAVADPPDFPPEDLASRALSLGFNLGQAEWSTFDADERYALIKLGSGEKPSHNLKSALAEFFTDHSIGVQKPGSR